MKSTLKSCFGAICVLHLCIIAQAQPQSKLSISARVDFYSIPINDPGTDIPDPKYEVNGKLGLNQAAYIDLNWWFANDFGGFIGLGMHTFDNSVDIFVPNYIEGFKPTVDDHRSWKFLSICPTVGLMWKWKKFQTQIGVSKFESIKVNQSHYSQPYTIHSFNPETETWHSVAVTEDVYLTNYMSLYTLWSFNFHYQLTDNTKIIFGYETTIGKILSQQYRLVIEEFDDLIIDNKTVSNDFKYLGNYKALTFGMSYTFNLKKGDNSNASDNLTQ